MRGWKRWTYYPQPSQSDNRCGRFGHSYTDFNGSGTFIDMVAPKKLKMVNSSNLWSFMVMCALVFFVLFTVIFDF
ncbi:hypothetical protein DPMN_059685 [Dreissena polymorpha]|uniref:Uncharacterized protein n=1 Tax=Dreissena polymorpha TaxID=45954 RepID=A0A9D4C3Y1_DREPO|nr:hypothetical protein DPMN_059685 [Dreissena polymorpha]